MTLDERNEQITETVPLQNYNNYKVTTPLPVRLESNLQELARPRKSSGCIYRCISPNVHPLDFFMSSIPSQAGHLPPV